MLSNPLHGVRASENVLTTLLFARVSPTGALMDEGRRIGLELFHRLSYSVLPCVGSTHARG